MINTKTIIHLIFSILLLSNCSKKKQYEEDYKFKSYFGLEIGNTWEYERSYKTPQTNDIEKVTYRILKDTFLANQQKAFIVEMKTGTFATTIFWTIEEGIFYEIQNFATNYEVKFALAKETEMKLNDSWIFQPLLPNIITENNIRKVLATNFSYSYLRYNLLATKLRTGNIQNYSYSTEDIFVPHLGFVNRKNFQEVYGQIHTIELKLIKNYNQ